MGILKDISDTLKDAKDIVKEVGIANDGMKKTSLAKLSSQATLQFPIITSRSINVDTAQSITKALERQYAGFVQMVISLNPYLDLSKGDMTNYLRKIHQNNPSAMNLEESCMSVYSDEALTVMFSLNEGCNGQILASNKKQMYSVTEHLSNFKLNDLHKPKSVNMALAEASMNHYCRENGIVMEAAPTDADIDKASDALELNKIKLKHQIGKDALDKRNSDSDQLARDAREDKLLAARNSREDKLLAARNSREDAMNKVKLDQDIAKANAEYRSKTMVKLSDNDVKKANELVPTTLSVTMQVKDGSSFGGVQNFVVGVKGLMHPVDSNEMISSLISGHKSGNKFFNFIRWTSGEISFLKDLILNIDGIKEDVVKKYSGGSHWWTTLKRRKTLSKVKNYLGKGKILPNASIVCSMEEVAEMKEVYGFDLMNIKNTKKLMDEYFLLGIAVVDNSQELCYFIFDGEANYQAVSFRGLEKENSGSNDFKEIYKMINSGRL